jgi:DNA-binding NarL/FixJ family response regulator
LPRRICGQGQSVEGRRTKFSSTYQGKKYYLLNANAKEVLEMFTHAVLPKAEYDIIRAEKEILHHLLEGESKKQIAHRLGVSFYTVDTHLRNIYTKLQVHSRSGAVAKALKEKLR